MWMIASLAASLPPITITLPPVPAANALTAISVALCAGTAAVLVHSWPRGGRASILAGLIFGLTPVIIAVAIGGEFDLLTALSPVATFVALDEILMRQRVKFWVVGGLLGLLVAQTALRTAAIMLPVAIAMVVTFFVVALFQPTDHAINRTHVLQTLGVAIPIAILAILYPLGVHIDDGHSISIDLPRSPSGTSPLAGPAAYIQNAVATGGVLVWLAAGAVLAALVAALRRAQLRWSLLPLMVAAGLLGAALVPHVTSAPAH